MSTIAPVASSDSLLNRNFMAACLSNLLFYISVYMLMPVMPLYLVDVMHTGKSVAGVVLSSFTMAALLIRPISGFLVDHFRRKPLYLICYFCFAAYFAGYLLATTLLVLLVVRCTHGLIFGLASTSASTLAIDTLPPGKLGRGIGIFGTTTSIAMSLGPMTGLVLMSEFSYQMVFAVALLMAVAAFCIGTTIHCETPPALQTKRRFSWQGIFLASAVPVTLCVIFPSFLYGMILNYLTLYARERGIEINPGFFFCLMAAGMILSRLVAGKLIDRGLFLPLIVTGKLLVVTAIFLFVFVPHSGVFFGSALLAGIGFGIVFPSYQTIFIRLARKEQRGTANSTYLTCCDLGIGIAIFFGGMIAEHLTFPMAFLTGALLTFLSILIFRTIGAPHFLKYQIEFGRENHG